MDRERRQRRLLWIAIAAGAVATLVVARGIAAQSWILGSPDAGWFYRYHQYFSWRIPGVAAVIVAGAALLSWAPFPRTIRGARLELMTWWLFALAAAWLLRSLSDFTLESLFTSDGASGFYSFAQQHSPGDLLWQFNRLRRTGPLHIQANMPGKVMLIYALELVTTNPSRLAALMVVLSSAGGFLAYAFARQLGASTRASLIAAILYWFYPARLLFLPIMNTITPLFVLGCACLLLRWLHRGQAAAAIALGVMLYALVFFEPLPLAIGVVFAALCLRSIAAGEIAADRWLLHVCLMLLAFIGASEAVHAATRFELVEAVRQTAAHARAFNVNAGRPYAFWLRGNIAEFAFGLGYCQALTFCAATVAALTRRSGWRDRLLDPFTTLAVALAAAVTTLDVLGMNRGEVIRLWLFLGVFVQILAARACSALPGRAALLVMLAASVLTAAFGIGMLAFASPA